MSILEVNEDPKENDKEEQAGKTLMKSLKANQSKEKMSLPRANYPNHNAFILTQKKVAKISIH